MTEEHTPYHGMAYGVSGDGIRRITKAHTLYAALVGEVLARRDGVANDVDVLWRQERDELEGQSDRATRRD